MIANVLSLCLVLSFSCAVEPDEKFTKCARAHTQVFARDTATDDEGFAVHAEISGFVYLRIFQEVASGLGQTQVYDRLHDVYFLSVF